MDNLLPTDDEGDMPLVFAKPPIGGVTDVPIPVGGGGGAEAKGSHNNDGFL